MAVAVVVVMMKALSSLRLGIHAEHEHASFTIAHKRLSYPILSDSALQQKYRSFFMVAEKRKPGW